jgi:hypothetical protein
MKTYSEGETPRIFELGIIEDGVSTSRSSLFHPSERVPAMSHYQFGDGGAEKRTAVF